MPVTSINGVNVPAIRERIGAVVDLLRAGDLEAGARQFVETVALGPGMWDKMPPGMRQTFVFNAPTFLDEQYEPANVMAVDLARPSTFEHPALITQGDESPPFFAAILEKVATALPRASRHTFVGAGHVPHLTRPDEFVRIVTSFAAR